MKKSFVLVSLMFNQLIYWEKNFEKIESQSLIMKNLF